MSIEQFTGGVVHTGITTAKDLLVLTAPAGYTLHILGAKVRNISTETNEQFLVGIYRASAAGTGAATAVTPKSNVAGTSVTSNATLEHTYASTEATLESDPLWQDGGASLSGVEYFPRNGSCIRVPAGEIIALRSINTVLSMNVLAEITWEEVTSGTPPSA